MSRAAPNLVIKIGTAALGAADGVPDAKHLGALAAELAALKQARHQVILVTSGAVGTGRALARKQAQSRLRPVSGHGAGSAQSSRDKNQNALRHCDPVAERQILASLGQARLMALYQELLTPHGLLASQILLTKQDFRSREHHKHMEHLFAALRQQPHILPIVNENDSVTVDELMFTDNDELAGLLAAMMQADRLIILSHIAGVYDRPPDEAGAAIIPLIDWAKKIGIPAATKGKSQGGRGGMESKLNIARKMAALGIQTHIAAAREDKIIARLLRDEAVGTTIAPLPVKRSAVKRWLASGAHATPAKVTANACLAGMMAKPGAAFSLLPVGLTKISGPFDKGDIVQIIGENGQALALGVARYDAAALRPALGKKNRPVFIHYDQLHRLSHDEPA
jgi:glutamate 5-kinase